MARDLLNKYGRSATFSRVTEGAYDPTDGTVAAGSSSNFSADVFLDTYNTAEINDTTVKYDDIKMYIEKPASDTPAVGDTVVIDSKTLRVLSVQTLAAQGQDIVYIAQCRQ